MTSQDTMTLEAVKTLLRRGRRGRLENLSGWGVFVDSLEVRRYIVDEAGAPVPFTELGVISRTSKADSQLRSLSFQ